MSATASVSGGGHREVRYWRNPIAIWALLLGVLVHIAGFFAFSIELPPDQVGPIKAPEIFYSGADERIDLLMQEQSELLDFEPLFLPTARNASVYLGWSELVERTEPFSALPPRLLINDGQFPSRADQFVEPIDKPLDMLERDTAGSFGAFGQVSGTQEALPYRAGTLEVYREDDSQVTLVKELESGIIDESVSNLSGVLEWRLAVGEIGIVGQALLIKGSGLEAVDAAAAQYLLQKAPEWGLPEGYYRVVIGP
ncbi:hypothetical protein [Cerasicoccus arenae]|uniref:Uncharacterized protein n=1 Tax=Cerasicoccus arenae TaxID=424488 RepID=A0A8J3DKA1_9BACT|nr:hypothetical protein [Cerasicoccus arenae]MBK1859473.1 hypothetical protein [Cerasicoccus arenae]GHC10948.1 hypothetical protein GCM10007047_30400 [Cerasicoccus arenae]